MSNTAPIHPSTSMRRPAGTLVGRAVLLVMLLPGALHAQKTDLAELPFWPHGLALPQGVPAPRKRAKGTAILAWAPPKARRIRAVLLIVANTDSKHFGEHAATRAVAARHEMGIVYLRYPAHADLPRSPESETMNRLLAAVARKTGIAEFRHAPWVTFGKSSMGKFPYYLAWAFPQRTVATISYHAETPTWPVDKWARLDGHTIPHVSLNGETEWGGTWNRHVRPSLLNYRARSGWLPHQAVVYDVGHGNYADVHGSDGWGKEFPGKVTCIRVWDYLAMFIDKALTLRLPKGRYPTDGPVTLKQIEENTGYLVRPYAIEDLFALPRIPMVRGGRSYVVDPKGETRPVFAAIPPAKDYAPPQGVPTAELELGRSPSEWLITQCMPFAMAADPMRDMGDLKSLRPKPEDKVTIDDHRATFGPIDPRYVRRGGGITLNNGLQKGAKATLLAYTVVEVRRRTHVKLHAPFTQNGRVQVVLNGLPVAHKQVLELDKGLYPMLVAVRLRTKWASLATSFEAAIQQEIESARRHTVELARRKANPAADPAARGLPKDAPAIRKASDVKKADRKNMFWLADRELADAWLRLHTRKF